MADDLLRVGQAIELKGRSAVGDDPGSAQDGLYVLEPMPTTAASRPTRIPWLDQEDLTMSSMQATIPGRLGTRTLTTTPGPPPLRSGRAG